MSQVSVIGLGDMGAVLAWTLLANGYDVTVWNRTGTKSQPLIAQGAVLAPTVANAVSTSPVTIICVSDYEATRLLLETEEVVMTLSGRLLIQLSTGTPQEARNAQLWTLAQGAQYLDGAIMATPSQVGQPETPIFISGKEEAFRQSEPLLHVLAGNLQFMGEAVGAASAWDLAVLSYAFGGIIGFYHGALLLEAESLSVDAYGLMIAEIAPQIGEMVRYESTAIATGDFSNPESSLKTCWKGMDLILKHAKEVGINSEFPAFATAYFEKGMNAGYGNLKAAALIEVLRKSA